MRARRQRLILLVALFPVTIVLAAVFGGMWIAVQLLTDLGLAGYIIHLRRAAQIERRLAITRVSIERRIEAERIARSRRRPVGSSFAYHERNSGSSTGERHVPAQPAEELTPEELAHARAETIDLGSLVTGQPPHRDDAGQDELSAPTRWAGGGAYPEGPAEVGEQAAGGYAPPAAWDDAAPGHPASGGHAKVLGGYAPPTGPGVPAGYEGVEYDEVEMDADEVAAASAAWVTARPTVRPPRRPTTSRPGRVQINPPGTHGGLIAPPEAASAGGSAAGPAPRQPVAGASAGEAPAELDPLLRRHAVGS
ncbi:hypothetical protein FraQA3DRAFT_5335 [Frankia sp. QA3]|nr:hypothetical protein [Frankia sp. QA3]EIV95505.1 hypothetical protein FraQA3DRAFT_5335 [Frankia sp. QA3]